MAVDVNWTGMERTTYSPEAAPLSVLVVHNAYQQRGGEDSVVESEVALLRAHGHRVRLYLRHNDDLAQQGWVSLAAQTLWSSRTTRELADLIAQERPDVIHVHNTLPLVSPSVFWAASKAGVAVVQTLHNFRMMCPQAMFVRQGKVCEDCVGHVPWRAVAHRCYRGSFTQSAALASTLTLHRALGTFQHRVDRYIALNAFCKDKFIEGGLPPERLSIKPNFVEWREAPEAGAPRSGGLFLSRLTSEKGVDVLLQALAQGGVGPLSVIGGGPMADAVAAALGSAYLGFLPLDQVWAHLAASSYLVVPSVWYEGFPRTIVEAYSCGLPVIASRLGSLAEVVQDGVTGLLFNPGDPGDLAAKMKWADAHPQDMAAMGHRARALYEARYAPRANATALAAIYREAMAVAQARS